MKMEFNNFAEDTDLFKMPKDSPKAITFIVKVLLKYIYPLISKISNILHNGTISEVLLEENIVQVRYVYTLCADQVKKCITTLIDIIKLESYHKVYLQESRNCTLERLSWCYNKLSSIEEILNKPGDEIDFDNPIFVSTMYFVNWIDQTFDLLNKLSTTVYKTDVKEKEELWKQWKIELVENVCGLHTSIDELLLCAMTLCKYCLPVDQPIVRARCQVVMRETKALLSDLIDGDLNTVKATTETLKLPIKPSNINVLIDVLKDVLYVLETNTNTALLALVVHCFSQNMSSADILKDHFEKRSKNLCTCCKDGDDEAESCKFIKAFDLHNERLLQIGSFAMSCSSDQKRILSLRGGLASLEALDPHLVPAVIMSPKSHHSSILINIWNQEVEQIRDGVFLIVDPAAFTDKVKQMMHQKILEITKDNSYDNNKICTVINMGCVIYKFFLVYNEFEPDALSCKEQLSPLLQDLNKVNTECKIVSNILCKGDDFKYNVTRTQKQTATFEQMLKRLKLLYTLIKRINDTLNPTENDEFYEEPVMKNLTETLLVKNTYVNSPRKITNNITRSLFARTNLRSSTGRFPLAVLTKHLKSRNNDLNFSMQLDQICNISEIKVKKRETSILYQTPLKTRSSLRKAVLNKQCVNTINKGNEYQDFRTSTISEKSLIDDSSLQITDVLNQINDLTCNMTTGRTFDSTFLLDKSRNALGKREVNGVKSIWNISVNSYGDSGSVSNVTQPSDVDTLDRINDLNFVESKLSDLKSGHIETSL